MTYIAAGVVFLVLQRRRHWLPYTRTVTSPVGLALGGSPWVLLKSLEPIVEVAVAAVVPPQTLPASDVIACVLDLQFVIVPGGAALRSS